MIDCKDLYLRMIILRSWWKFRYQLKLWRGQIATQGSHKYDLECDHWFKIEMIRFIETDETFPTTPQVGIVLVDYRFGFKIWNVLARYDTVREYWGAIHARNLMRKQFPYSFLTNEPGALNISQYTSAREGRDWKSQ